MDYLLSQLDNRELAFAIWGMILLIFCLVSKPIRRSLYKVVHIIATSQIGTVYLLITLYTMVVVLLLQKLNFWEVGLIKETVLWLVGVGYISLGKLINAKLNGDVWQLIIDSLKLTVLVEFVINFYVMPFGVELVIWPFIALIAMTKTFAEIRTNERDYGDAVRILKGLESAIGIIVGGYVLYCLIFKFTDLLLLINLKELLLPILLTLSFLPIIYSIIYWMRYESLSVRLDFFIKGGTKSIRRAKWEILKASRLSLSRLSILEKRFSGRIITTEEELKKALEI